MQPAGSWPGPWPGNLARPKHGTARWPLGPGRPSLKDQDVPGPPPRPTARHGHDLVKEAARCLQRLVRQAAGSPAHEAASPAAVYMLPLGPPIPNPNPTPLPPLAVAVVSSRSLSIRRLELAAARLELAGPALPPGPPIPNPNPTPLLLLIVAVVSSRSLSIRRLELTAARLEIVGPASVTRRRSSTST